MDYAVKKGASLPPPRVGVSRHKYPFATVGIGDMFFVPDKTTKQLSTYAALCGRKLGRRFRTQTAHMRQDLLTNEWEPCKPGAIGSRRGVAITRTL